MPGQVANPNLAQCARLAEMREEIKDKNASVKARLLNMSREMKVDFDALLLRYFQERFLYRLMLSEFSNHFILKGGFLLICLNIPLSRPTKDIDFLVRGLKNSTPEFESIFKRIAEIVYDDGVHFDPASIYSERIIVDNDYKGIRIKIDAFLGKARNILQFDIGFGDSVWPKPNLIEFPTLLEEMKPWLKAYSKETIIAEKFEIMLKLEMLNSRLKDFYDIYTLSLSCNFNGQVLKKSIEKTLLSRQTMVTASPFVFREEFYHNPLKQLQWSAFLKKTRITTVKKEFCDVMERITDFLKPVLISIVNKTPMEKFWNAEKGFWEDI
ncbi:MAG TPA: nucleotidyl transferase AbiEii/AbiGii toxin family protein [Candidatus Kapabacteria bacterium]|nr:nucleotidyl transferase AbiEii/AbiGii toxin family protein [Candidatus Kapabacteria bacterium]